MNAEKKTPTNRIVYGQARERYDAEDRVNWSTLKLLAKSPAHYRDNLINGRADKSVYRLGRVTHMHVYEPERVRGELAVWEGGRRYGNEWDAFVEENAGREILTAKEVSEVRAIANAVRSDPHAQKYVNGGKGEPTLLWDHVIPAFGDLPEYVFKMKGRPDFIASCGAIVDLKSTKNAHPDKFASDSWNFGYHAQAALYVDGYEAITGQRLPYVIIAVEKTAPYVVQVFTVEDDMIEEGREHYRDLLGTLAFCKNENVWPGYAPGPVALQRPTYLRDHEADDDVSDLPLTFPEGEAQETA